MTLCGGEYAEDISEHLKGVPSQIEGYQTLFS